MKLEGKVAIITGAGSPNGMGQAIALRLAEDGADIVVSDLQEGKPDPFQENFGYQFGAHKGLDAVIPKIETLGRKALAITADVTKTEEVKSLVKSTKKQFGRIDILVNVAGGAWGPALIKDYDEDAFIRTFEVNMFGTFRMCKYALPYIIRKKGTIINISSLAATQTGQYYSAYGASKAAIKQFTESLAVEYSPKGVRAFSLLPGVIETDLWDFEVTATSGILNIPMKRVKELYAEAIPLHRFGKTEDVANLISFLCSDEASFLTGLSIYVTGGMELGKSISELKL
ncbi:MAG: SDR family oxidoreductase [Promethearchaeota archaeon]|nr:MAG: SDR family oxidoreductase [Candidatus Lokiarchaeota archaeon]